MSGALERRKNNSKSTVAIADGEGQNRILRFDALCLFLFPAEGVKRSVPRTRKQLGLGVFKFLMACLDFDHYPY